MKFGKHPKHEPEKPKHEPVKSHKHPEPERISLEEMKVWETPLESRLPAAVPVALPLEPMPVESPLDEARNILEQLAAMGPARLGTSHGAALVTAALKWLAVHGKE